ncbi:MAG: xanthine dehydrogenase accessory protein XdhC [Gammaproteobacteria bacterium]|jgi:xanthine dehydrogenase accessory factor|nr:xanthine dehydrogenase accessory protein XdhC [Gammaproteobacteria bacterium]MBT5601134.1 xanthine dehydrogenase accessory protein XdhC [Gammaproteobacteria bacterium]MBT6246962.1 xanthine dehydrogenase accessory protein XdhC [Gammaproteobacteria bacterium]
MTISWQQAVHQCHQQGQAFAVATILTTAGSTPRDGGSKMIITSEASHDSVGGGRLELLVLKRARELLATGVQAQLVEHFPLAGKAQQCCGGSVSVLLEVFPEANLRIALFGAGHVGQALVSILAGCDARIDWIDSRQDMFPALLPANAAVHVSQNPVEMASLLTRDQIAVIVTHDHQLDYQLVRTLLDETEVPYIGLIGSKTKAERFRTRLVKDNLPQGEWDRCHCPVGLASIPGKLPMEVAVSIAAEILALAPAAARSSVSWKAIKKVLREP